MCSNFITGRLWHGADYNPEQWAHVPGIFEADLKLLRSAGMTSLSLGIFSWAEYEPREGEYNFEWLDHIIESLHANGQNVVLATPSGGKPNWLGLGYPEVRRVNDHGQRAPQHLRHNHCPTSPIYREKTAQINARLAERYGNHPALLAWHLSNEYGGYCYCDLCFAAFREWLKERYGDNLDNLNRAYWSRFWSHTYNTWEEISHIDYSVHGLNLDWRRFMTYQMVDFMKAEIAVLRQFSSAPVTTNLMGNFEDYIYPWFAREIDFVSWDAYPEWGNGEIEGGDDLTPACWTAWHHDLYRAIKQKPFWLMECTPNQTNWQPTSKLKAPGVNRLSAWQAVAHGAANISYFQWRQSRGSSEKFHGAVVSHAGHAETRTFKEVSQLGRELAALPEVASAGTPAQIALFYDVENVWATRAENGPQNQSKKVPETQLDFYRPLWENGYAVDVITSTADISPYKLIVAPMLYMLQPGVAESLTEWVRAGGTLVTTYWSGMVNESDLCFLGGFPGPLRGLLGIWVEETDALYPHQHNRIKVAEPICGVHGSYEAADFCDIIHLEGARALASYEKDFYAGTPAFTVNQFGQGCAYYIGSRNESRFQHHFLSALARKLALPRALPVDLPHGVVTQRRATDQTEWIFVLNFTATEQSWPLPGGNYELWHESGWAPALTGTGTDESVLPPYGVAILRRDLALGGAA